MQFNEENSEENNDRYLLLPLTDSEIVLSFILVRIKLSYRLIKICNLYKVCTIYHILI